MQADGYGPNVALLGVLVQAEDKSWHVIEVYERDVDRMEAEHRSQLQHIHIIAQVRSCQPTNPNLNLFVMQLNRTVDQMEGRLAVQVLHNTSLLEKNHTCVRRIKRYG